MVPCPQGGTYQRGVGPLYVGFKVLLQLLFILWRGHASKVSPFPGSHFELAGVLPAKEDGGMHLLTDVKRITADTSISSILSSLGIKVSSGSGQLARVPDCYSGIFSCRREVCLIWGGVGVGG